MITILFNTETNKPISNYLNGGYTVDGNPQAVSAPIMELEVLTTAKPEILDTQKISSEWVADLEAKQYVLTWYVTNKTDEEIIEELNQQAEQVEEQVKDEEYQKLIDTKVEELRTSISTLTDGEALDYRTKYKPYKVPMTLKVGDRFYYPLNDKLYRVIGPEGTEHITQLDWKPTTAVSLYVEVTPPGVIADWVQPLGAHDAYQTGDKVNHNGSTWESTVDNNTWEPGVYGWVIV